jgi:hypothetical protein
VLERPDRGVEHPPPFSVEVENVQSYASHLRFVTEEPLNLRVIDMAQKLNYVDLFRTRKMECGRRRRIMNGWADILIEKET